jgi:nicotinamide mononucleotide adenylyltransferase
MKETVIVVYGRMNPPTKGHEELIKSAMRIKKTGLPGTKTQQSKWLNKGWHENVSSKYFNNDTHVVFQPLLDASHLSEAKVVVMVTESYVGKKISSENKKKSVVKNPLKPENKVEMIRSMVDTRSVKVVTVPSLYTIFTEYPEDKYNVVIVLGSDRVYGKERMSLISKAAAVVSIGRPETAYSSTKLKTLITQEKLKNARNMVSNKVSSKLFNKMVKKVKEGQRIHMKSKK